VAGKSIPEQKSYMQGYVMKLSFAQAQNGRVAGRIYVCLPDEEKTVVAGTFEAEIR